MVAVSPAAFPQALCRGTRWKTNCALRFPIIKRAGLPEDVGPTAVWLAGTGVGYVTGQIFPVDGGLTQHL
jgi:NAD(P)-dependent dehydrogenase (short-subunit alcohol dehydrogenase family)